MFPTLENQVADLKSSQELKKFGYPQIGLFWWWINKLSTKSIPTVVSYGDSKIKEDWIVITAPTSSEIGYWLPENIRTQRYKDGWLCWSTKESLSKKANTEVQAKTNMLLYGLKNKLWKFEKGKLAVL